MNYGILSSSGNIIQWHDDLDAGREALEEMARRDPGAAPHVALVGFDDDGSPTGETFVVPTVEVAPSAWLRGTSDARLSVPVPASASHEPEREYV